MPQIAGRLSITIQAAVPPSPWTFTDIVDINWAASTSPNVTYNVNRATVSGGPYTVIASNVNALTWRDYFVTPGTTYYYVVDAVDVNNNISPHSAEQAATALTP